MANDPVGTGKKMYDTLHEGPGRRARPSGPRAARHQRPRARLKKAATVAKHASPTRRRRRAGPLVKDGPDRTPRRTARDSTDGTDPVDLATGKMFLPQTDVTLPGSLPLVFTRRVESGYAVGRCFGPVLDVTVDQRLEIDADGVVHVTEDGLLLAYPHPAPGVPTLPERGPAVACWSAPPTATTRSPTPTPVGTGTSPPRQGGRATATALLSSRSPTATATGSPSNTAPTAPPLALVHSAATS